MKSLTIALVGLIFSLTACSFAPIPINVNLLEPSFSEASGSFEITTPSSTIDLTANLGAEKAGTIGPFSSPIAPISVDIGRAAGFLNLDLNLPTSSGLVIDFRDQTLPAELNAASLSYTLGLSKTGAVEFDLRLQPYLAPIDATTVVSEQFALGEEKTLRFTGEASSLSDTVELNQAQLSAINQKELRLVIAITGGTLRFTQSGDATLSYDLTSLSLNVANVSTSINEALPDREGISFDFSKEDIPADRLRNLGLDYSMNLSIIGDIEGTAQSQIFIAPGTETEIAQAKYAFGSPQTIDLSQSSVVITERATFNDAQLDLLESKTAKVIILVTGEARVALGQTIEVNYDFTKLSLFGGYSLN